MPASVAPGSSYTFNFTITAPSTPGTYNFCWNMLHEGVAWIPSQSPNTCVNDGTSSPTPNTVITVNAVVPTVDTPTKSNIANNGATLGATVESNGGSALTARGVCWSKNSSPNNCNPEGGTATGAYTMAANPLSGNTHYYYRGYATNAIGLGYSNDDTFLTKPSAPSGIAVSNATSSSLHISWNGPVTGEDSFNLYRCQGSGCTPTLYLTGISNTFYDDTSLAATTLYRYQASSQNATGESALTAKVNGTTLANNTAPTAHISVWPTSLVIGKTYTLTAVGSSDAQDCSGGDDGTANGGQGCFPGNYAWSVVLKPANSTATIGSGAYSETFTPDVAGSYKIGLVVTDSGGLPSPQAVTSSSRTLPSWIEVSP